MKTEVIVIGDVEIGAGTLTDDFIADTQLVALIDELSERDHAVHLVFNGDTFDFLKCPYIKDGKKKYPRHITDKASLNKLELMYDAHTSFFEAMARFIQKKENLLFFVIGNHDHDLFHAPVRRKIRKLLAVKHRNVKFGLAYKYKDVYAEHGQQYDFLNQVQKSEIFVQFKGKQILQLPFVSLGIMSRMMFMKERNPFLERINPKPIVLRHQKPVLHKMIWEVTKYFLLSIFYYPLRYLQDPTYNLPRGLLPEFLRRARNAHFDVDSIVEVFKRRRKRLMKRYRIHVLGHVHEKYVEEKEHYVLLHPDTWRDEYTLDDAHELLIPKIKRYVKIIVEDGKETEWKLVEVENTRSTIKFKDVLEDEIGAVRKAAAEEGYELREDLLEI